MDPNQSLSYRMALHSRHTNITQRGLSGIFPATFDNIWKKTMTSEPFFFLTEGLKTAIKNIRTKKSQYKEDVCELLCYNIAEI